MLGGHLPHGFKNAPLRGHIQAGGGFVEHDHPWPTAEGHCDADTLLLTTRHLVRIAVEETPRWRAARPPPSAVGRARSTVCAVAERHRCGWRSLRAAVGRPVNAGFRPARGILRHVGDQSAACLLQAPCRSRLRMSTPSMQTRPPAMRRPLRARPRSATPTVLLPEPDSPTRPRTCPRATRNVMSSTTGVPRPSVTTVRPSTTRPPSSDACVPAGVGHYLR